MNVAAILIAGATLGAGGVTLFDGETFDGWEGNLEVFRIEDGAIVGGTLEERIPRNEFLCTTAEYGDFELRLEVKLLGAGANGGIQFWSQRIPDDHEVSGYQADMGQIFWGSLYDESRRNRILAAADQDRVREILREEDWNDYRIRAEGPRIRLWLNGMLTVDYMEEDDSIPRRGIIGVQIHSGPPSEAWYRNIVIEELEGAREGDSAHGPDWLEGRKLEATWTGGVGLIVEHRCVTCHREGEGTPMTFSGYEDLREWARRTYTPLDALIQTRGMPPWPADPEAGAFRNAEYMTEGEQSIFLEWIAAGLPRGAGEFEFTTEWAPGWRIGEPDHVFDLGAYAVGESVEGEYRELMVETDFAEDRWIVAAEARPGDDSIVMGIDGGPLGQYRPGAPARVYADGTGRLLRAGETVKVRIHYLKDVGYSPVDQSRLGVMFAKDGTGRREVVDAAMEAEGFTIPAETAGFVVETEHVMEAGGRLVSVMPSMRQRGRSVTYTLTAPGEAPRTVLRIPEWDPRWQYRYVFAEPIVAPAGSVVRAVAEFDNSEGNLKNPDPWSAVSTGPSGETFEGWVAYTVD